MKAYTITYVPHEDDEDNVEYALPCVFVGQALAQEHANQVDAEHADDKGTWEVREVIVYEDLPQQVSQFVLTGKMDLDGNVVDRNFREYKSWDYTPTLISGSGYHSIHKNFKDGSYYAAFSVSGENTDECEQMLEQRKKQMMGDIQTRIENAQKTMKKKAAPAKIVLPNPF